MNNLLPDLKKYRVSRQLPKLLPEEAGVYIFWSENSAIYIGKAKNLKNRVGSYFNLKLSLKTGQMVRESDSLSFIKVASELESLLLEAYLIRTVQPKYNFQAKDDKHPLYIKITDEKYPRVLTARKEVLLETNNAVFGPFPSSANVKLVLKMIRKIFPFSTHRDLKRPCIESHIGLCNPCPSIIESAKDEVLKAELTKDYKRNIRMIKRVLARQINIVHDSLQKEMNFYARAEMFEKATEVRNKIQRLEYINQPIIPKEYFLQNPDLLEDLRKKELNSLQELLKPFLNLEGTSRIECFDVAHLAGVNQTASMVTFINGSAEKAFYRHFRINQSKRADDVASMKEVITRRIKHLRDWGEPDLIIVDGGKTQSKVFFEKLEKLEIPVVGLAKRFETLVIPQRIDGKIEYNEVRVPEGPTLNLVQRIRNEAHRFARRYHHKLITKSLIP